MDAQAILYQRLKRAKENPYQSIVKQFVVDVQVDTKLVGIKDVEQIPKTLLDKLQKVDNYVLHTLDAHSDGGRAIDLHLVNPISGRWMSGSSSGSALNVVTMINDVGIGTDGGGSVLCPAICVNLFGFISPLIEAKYMQSYRKVSTDGISFSPSIGFFTREFKDMKEVVSSVLPISKSNTSTHIYRDKHVQLPYSISSQPVTLPDVYGARKPLIEACSTLLRQCDVLVCYEEELDLQGFGDTVFGHFDKRTQKIQKDAKKGIVRVANMVGATAISIPSDRLGCAYVLLCESKLDKIGHLMQLASTLAIPQDALIKRYFSSLYLEKQKGYSHEEESN